MTTRLLLRHSWILNCAGLALIAFMASTIARDTLSAHLFPVPEPPAQMSSGARGDPLESGVRPDDRAAESLKNRWLFGKPAERPKPAPEMKRTHTLGVDSASERPVSQTTDLPIELIGTAVATDPNDSVATLKISGESRLAWEGSELLDGEARVMKIGPKRVALQRGQRIEYVNLGFKPAAAKAKDTLMPGRKAPRRQLERLTRTQTQPIKMAGRDHYEVDGSWLKRQRPTARDIPRLVPFKRSGLSGVKLLGIRPGSLGHKLGLRNGDVLLSINGDTIDSPNQILALAEALKGKRDFELKIQRRGNRRDLRYTMK